jgi:hypothetical protein
MTNVTVQELMTGIYTTPKDLIEGHFIKHWIQPQKKEKSNSSTSNK